jgi:hypothetical protein
MKIIKGDLILKEDTTIEEDLIVEGNIRCEGGLFNLDCGDLNCVNLNCGDLNCGDLDFYSFAIAYNSFKCKSWKARRDNFIIKCLDREIEIKKDKVICDKCGQEIKQLEEKE